MWKAGEIRELNNPVIYDIYEPNVWLRIKMEN